MEIERAIKGDKKAYEQAIEEIKGYLYNIAIAITKNEEEAGDAISETIIKSYTKLKTLRKPEYFKTWITRILINESRKILKEKKKVISLDEYREKAEEPYRQEKEEIRMDLEMAINLLGENLRIVVLLYYYNDFSMDEIAQILNIPLGTVKSRLFTAKKYLFQILSKDGEVKRNE